MWKWWEPRDPDEGGPPPEGDPVGDRVGDPVGDECEAWLAGEWAEYRAARGEAVPGWAWLNRVAHAPEHVVLGMTRIPLSNRHDIERSRLRACAAEALIRQAAEKGTSVDVLQRSVLVPIELALFEERNPYRAGDALLLIRVLTALREAPVQHEPR